MRKNILLLCLCLFTLGAQASTVDTMASYIYSSDYNQARIGAAVPIGLNISVGLEGKYVEDKLPADEGGLKKPVYSVYVPVQLNFDLFRWHITPFYYFKNDPHQPNLQEMYAYGLNSGISLELLHDDINEHYSHAFINVSYVRQKANIFEKQQWGSENYDQFAFTLGLQHNFFNAFSFQIAGTAFQYPDGISRVDGFQGILDNKDLAFSESFDVNRSLGKYTLSARLTRAWIEKRSSIYLGYHYAEAYTANPEHSMVLGNTFYATENTHVNIAYNHLQDSHGKNKRDLVYASVNIGF